MANLPSYEDLMKSGKPVDKPTEASLPSYDELMNKPSDEGGLGQDIGDLAKSVAQGALLGGGDEALGAVQGTMDYLTDPKVKSWLEAYRARQQAAENEYNKVKERSPVLSTIGEVGGALALPGGELMALGKEAGLAGKAALMAGTGALAGGLSSSGTIEGNPEQLAKDAGLGATMGVGTEIGLNALKAAKPLIQPAIKGAENYIADSPKLRQILASWGRGMEGKSFTGNKAKQELQEELESGASKLGSDLDKMKEYGQGEYSKVLGVDKEGKLLENAPRVQLGNDSQGLKTVNNLEAVMNDMTQSPYHKQMLDVLNNLKTGEPVAAQDIKNLQKYLRDNQFVKEGAYRKELSEGTDLMNDLLKKVPGYEGVNELHGAIQDPINSFVKNVPADEMDIASRPKNATLGTTTFKAAEDVLKKSELPYGMGDKQSNQLRLLREGLENLQAKDPKALEAMGINNIDDYFKTIQKQSDIQAVARGIEKSGEMNKNLFDTLSPDLNTIYKATNLAGQVTGGISKALYSMPKEKLTGIALQLQGNPSTAHLGRALLNVNSESAKNAVLFSIMQSPDARKQLGSMMGMPSEDANQK